MVRPVELQDNFSKAPLAAREQHVQQNRPDMAQQLLTREVVQEQILDHSRTRPTEQKDPAEMRVYDREERLRRGGQRQGRRRSRQEDEGSSESAETRTEKLEDEETSGHIDIVA